MPQYYEKEIMKPVLLCNSNGKLNPEAVGWSRNPLHICNLRGNRFRKKKWNYWCITSDNFAFSICLANVDYIGLAFGYFLDYNKKKLLEQTVVLPFGRGCYMPQTANEDIEFYHRKMNLSIKHHHRGVMIKVESASFQNKKISADIIIEKPKNHETLNVVIPWSKDRFQFTSKQNCLPAGGTVKIDSKTYIFNPKNSFACLDYGRGIWPYRTIWNWASGSGWQNNNSIGLQFGGKWTDGTNMNENGICFNGKLHKISEDIIFSYNRNNFMEPWIIRTDVSNKVNLKIMPFFEKVTYTNLFFLKTKVHQVFGHFSGTVEVENQTVNIDRIVGWSEEHIAMW